MDIFTQMVYVIGRIQTGIVQMLGTGFIITNDGRIVTSRHVVGDDDKGLVILAPHIRRINQYQDTTDKICKPIGVKIIESDPFRDITILKADITWEGRLPELGTLDSISIGESVGIFGYPHCVEGRRVLTYHKAEIGSKILLHSEGIKTKSAVINTQTRPGQSGSIIFSLKESQIIGMLVGAFAPNVAQISLGGINPRELHQTTHCISAEYIKNMIS